MRLESDAAKLHAVRSLVPSPRELGEVEAGPEKAVAAFQAEKVQVPIGDRLRGFARQLDIRDITAHGPALPLILGGYLGLITQLDTASMSLLLPEIKNSFGFSLGFYIAMNNFLAIVVALVAPFMGFVADRARRTTMLAGGAVISHASIALRGFATSVGGLVGFTALGLLGTSIATPANYPLQSDYYPPQTRGRVFAFFALTGTLGGTVAPLIGGLVANAYGWQMTLRLFGGIAALMSLSFFLLKEPKRGAQDRLAAGAPPEVAKIEQRPLGWGEAWRAAASIRTLKLIWVITPFTTCVVSALGPVLALYYTQKFHLTVLDRGVLGSIAAIPVLLGLLMSGPITDRILAYKPGRIMTLLAGLNLVGVVGLLVLVFTPFLGLAVLINAIPQFFDSLVAPALAVVISLIVPPRIRGLGLQTIAPFTALGLLGGIFLVIYGSVLGLSFLIVLLAGVHLLAAVVTVFAGGRVEEDIRAARAASLADEASREARKAGLSKLLIVRDLDVVYDGARVLFGLDLDVDEGEMLALLGTNGAGKSTLLRAIAGIQQASNGAVFLDGDDITHLPPQQMATRGIVMMPGGHAVFPTLTVQQNLDAAGWLYRADKAYLKQKVEEVLTRFPRLRERLGTRAGDLSGGEQQMVALSQALLMKPRLLMIDELSLGLAPAIVEMLLDVLREINRQGTTVILVEQSVNVALQVARRAVYMEKGEIRFDGTVAELMSRPDVVRSVFLGGAATAGNLAGRGRELHEEAGDRETVLDVQRVSLDYGGVSVLHELSLSVERGEIVGLVGPNGAGKTSLFDVITGFAKPASGAIHVLGRDMTKLPPDARARLGVARSYQSVRLFPALTVRENVAVALSRHLAGTNAVLAAVWSPQTRKVERRVSRRVENLVESLGLGAYGDKFVNELSTGTRRVVDIACLLAAQPRLLLLDEPSSGLAQAETEQLAPVIQRIVKETGCAVLVIEHDLGLVAAVSNRLIAMRLGSVMAEGTPAEVLGNAEVVEALLGGASEAVLSRSIALEGAGR